MVWQDIFNSLADILLIYLESLVLYSVLQVGLPDRGFTLTSLMARFLNKSTCLEFATLVKRSTKNPGRTSLVLEHSVKPCLGCQIGSQGLALQKMQEPLTQSSNLIRVVGVKVYRLGLPEDCNTILKENKTCDLAECNSGKEDCNNKKIEVIYI